MAQSKALGEFVGERNTRQELFKSPLTRIAVQTKKNDMLLVSSHIVLHPVIETLKELRLLHENTVCVGEVFVWSE